MGFLDTSSLLGRKGAQSGKATLHRADRQLQTDTLARRNRLPLVSVTSEQGRIFWGRRDLGAGFWVFLFVFGCLSFLLLRVAACLCVFFLDL
jgi:hypothetical protein